MTECLHHEEPAGGALHTPGATSTRRRGSSNSRSRFKSVASSTRSRRVRARQISDVQRACEEGRIGYLETERLVGFLMLGPEVFPPRTRQRRWRRLGELGILELTELEAAVAEVTDGIESGQLTYLQGERQIGRLVLGQLAASGR